jgi:hypothetical protein
MPPPASPDIDALREKLRSLGYLDAGVDRFVLGPARRSRSVRGLAWRASVRIGVLAGLLAGVSGAIAVAVRVPGLVTGARDALVVAASLGVLFGLATAAGAFVVTLLANRVAGSPRAARWVGGRARRAALLAGTIVGVTCLAYLTLWWRATGGTTFGSAFATALAVATVTVVSLLLGYTTTVTAQAVLALDPEASAPLTRVRLSWGHSAALAAAGLAAATTLLWLTSTPEPRPRPAPTLVVVPTGIRVLVIGIDGFDPAFARTLAARGSVPVLGRLETAAAPLRPGEAGSDPVPTWASIATGQPPARHGAVAIESRRVAGLAGRLPGASASLAPVLVGTTDLLRLTRPVVSSGTERQAPAFWEVAARAGLRAGVVNWWTTWPATDADGTVVSERATLRFERGGPLEGEVAPATVHADLRGKWPAMRERARGTAAAASRSTDSTGGGLAPWVAAAVERAVELDAEQVELTLAIDPARLDLVAVYLPGLDIAQGSLVTDARATPSSLAERLSGLQRTYVALDRMMGRLVAALPDHAVMLVTHPGRFARGVPATLAISGLGDAVRPAPASEASLLDVAPSVLALLGVPLSRELPGHLRTDLLPPSFSERHPTRWVETYGDRATVHARGGAASPALDDEMRERLRSLGYVQ